MNELGAEFDGVRKSRFAMGQDAAADTISPFEHGNPQTGIVQISRRGKPGRAGTDDDDVGARCSAHACHARRQSKRCSAVGVECFTGLAIRG